MIGWLDIRGNLTTGRRSILLIHLLALSPVILMAIVNCGYQYLRVIEGMPEFDAVGLRDWLGGYC